MYTTQQIAKLLEVNSITEKKSELLRWINEEKIHCTPTEDGTFRISNKEVQRLFYVKWKPIIFQQVKQYETTIQAMLSQLGDPYTGALGKLEALHGLVRWGFATLAGYRYRLDHDILAAKQLFYFSLQILETYDRFAKIVLEELPYASYFPVSFKQKVLWAMFSQRFDIAFESASHYQPNDLDEKSHEGLMIKYLLLKQDNLALDHIEKWKEKDPEYDFGLIYALLENNQQKINRELHIKADFLYRHYSQEMITLPYELLCEDILLYGWIAQGRGIPVVFQHPLMSGECFKKHHMIYPEMNFLPEELKRLIYNRAV
ncbi:hypothetical protein [Thermoflavimicrobium daqui]|uniref:Uncharacterized protein n=1 Tax=Thermoflavimicrobium daqui TaxID=2137476 RepID=A0A364K0A3_9BACL|nr:hypothetical protein [Thermoflavimicrobium daqui]RAL20649.1 hypothetical protein DL897_17950 [Thermoflavimicrobium daqui]